MKKILLISGILVLIVLGFFIVTYERPKIGNEFFTLEPEPWIESLEDTPQPGDVEINVFKATRGTATVNTQEDLEVEGNTISLFYYGSYKGIPFQTVYVDELYYNVSQDKSLEEEEDLADEYTLMQIGPEMDPNDGIINGLILAKEENSQFVIYVFVDEDWKNSIKYTNIVWGNDLKDPLSLHNQLFDFSRQKDGVYINKVNYDLDWIAESPSKGGLIVGEIDFNIINKVLNFQDINETFMYVR